MNNSTATIPIWTNDNESERTLMKWKKLYNETEILVDSLSWTGHYKHPLGIMLWDLTKLIARLEQGMK